MAKGKHPTKRTKVGKKVRILQKQIAAERQAVINGLVEALAEQLTQELRPKP